MGSKYGRGDILTTGEKIKQARKNAGITQKNLGDKLGVSPVMISQYESNTRNPKWQTLQKIADALNVTLSDLLTSDTILNSEKSDITDWLSTMEEESYRDKIDGLACLLNDTGQQEAVRQMELLTKIPEYRKEDTPE